MRRLGLATMTAAPLAGVADEAAGQRERENVTCATDQAPSKRTVANVDRGSDPGIDRNGHQKQKRGSPRDDCLLRRLVPRLDHMAHNPTDLVPAEA